MVFIDEITSLNDDGNCVHFKSSDFCELILVTIWLRKLEWRKVNIEHIILVKKVANWYVSNCNFKWKTTTEYVNSTWYYLLF